MEVPDINKLAVKDYFNRNSSLYHSNSYGSTRSYAPLRYRQQYVESMIDQLSLSPNSKILDAGCGPGELLISLSKRGFKPVGIDVAEEMITRAHNVAKESGAADSIHLEVQDVEHMTFGSSTFDLVVAAGLIEYQKNERGCLKEIYRVLRPGGFLIINVTNRRSYLYFLWELRQALGLKDSGPFLKRRHAPKEFDTLLDAEGYQKLNFHYFHFSPLPRPLDARWKALCDRSGCYMERWTRSWVAPYLAGGYLVLAQKRGQN